MRKLSVVLALLAMSVVVVTNRQGTVQAQAKAGAGFAAIPEARIPSALTTS
jgi:hypothetical protein